MTERKRKRSSLADQVKKTSKSPAKNTRENKKVPDNELVKTGSTRLDLLGSHRLAGALRLGKGINFIGDSSSGKTFVAVNVLAEAANDNRFKDYDLNHDDVEEGCEFDIPLLFGKKADKRIEFNHSNTIEELGDTLLKKKKAGKPFIYVVDSYDALDCEEEERLREEESTARAKGNKIPGSYKMAKPKKMHEIFRMMKSFLGETKSMLIIISQTKDNIGGRTKKKRNAANALEFNCSQILWFVKSIPIKSLNRIVGNEVKVKFSKNRNTGYKNEEIILNIYNTYGVDDIGSCIDFMAEEEYWKKKKNTIIADDFDLEGTRDKLIKLIEADNLENDLKQLVEERWQEIMEKIKPKRKSKYE